jgi:uncharacterized protein (DUF433 family)
MEAIGSSGMLYDVACDIIHEVRKTMPRYPLSLPVQLKQEAERLADAQGVSLNQFILWAVAEKVGGLAQDLDDPRFPHVHYRLGGVGEPVAVLRGSGVRVGTVVGASEDWSWPPEQIADEYGLRLEQVRGALAFYRAHSREVDAARAATAELEPPVELEPAGEPVA